MKKVKLTYYLVMLLSLISLVSVGFASWTVTDDFSTTASGMIVVDDVMKVNDYITCSSNVNKFAFFKTGFVDETGKVSNVGTIETTLTVNIANCKKKFPECNTLEIDLSLESEYLSLFNSVGNLEMNVELKNGEDVITTTNTSGDKLYLSIFDLSDFKSMADKITINVVYTFEIKNIEYFKTNVYPILLRQSFNFVLSAKLTGKVV